jgi:hypothetical protein
MKCCEVGRTSTSARGLQTPQFTFQELDLEVQRGTEVPPHHNGSLA